MQAKGLCSAHYQWKRQGKPLDPHAEASRVVRALHSHLTCLHWGGWSVAQPHGGTNMNVVYAATTATLAHGGQRHRITIGEVWDANDPLVAQYPDMFTTNPRGVRTTTTAEGWAPYPADGVETARRGPGEKRVSARRPRS